VLDLANGATYSLAPELFASLGATTIPISNKPDGTNINLACGSTHLENLQKAMSEYHGDVGLAFDGDGDRMLAVDETGRILDGDQIMFIVALDFACQGKLRNNLVVATMMSNYGLEESLLRNRITLRRTVVGDRYVVEEMIRSGAVLGGEQSGHIIFLDKNTMGDGLITGVELLAILKRSGRPLSSLASQMVRYPQAQINVKVTQTAGWTQSPVIQSAISSAERELRGDGRVFVRASGTEPLIRIMVEGRDSTHIHRIAEKLAETIQTEMGT